MKSSKNTFLTLGVLAAVVCGGWLLATKPWADPPPITASHLAATLELAAGDVRLAGGEAAGTRLLSGTPLPHAARVETGDGARAMVRLADGSRVFLDGGTTVEIDVGMTLVSGRVWLDAPPLEQEQDPTSHTLALGDTTLTLANGGASLEVDDGRATVYVAEGLAVVSGASGRSEVESGEQAVIAGEAAPTIEPVAFWNDWTGGMGDRGATARLAGAGSGSLYAVDRQAPPGTPALPLSIQRQSVQITVRDAVAETVVDQSFFNPSGRPVEGYYWFTVPREAQLVSFALETDGRLVEGEIVERAEAKATYEAAVARATDPALLEWIDERTVRARIFPVPGLGARRTVLRYQQVLSETEGKLRYAYPLSGGGNADAPTIEEFSLAVDLGDLGRTHDLATLSEARVEDKGRRVTMRRSGYTPRADFELELTRKDSDRPEAMRLNVIDPGGDQASYVMVRWAPDLDFDAAPTPAGDVVVVVDTSAAGDTAEQHTKMAVAEALLHSLSAGDRFAVMSADVTATVLHPTTGLVAANDGATAEALEKVAAHGTGGATDLGAIFEQALARVHGLEQPAIVYVGDGIVTSGERGAEQLAERLRRSMVGSRARLFTVGVGSDVDEAMLTQLARVGGGNYLRVDSPEQAVLRALQLSGSLKTPTLTDLNLELGEGLDDVFISSAGKLSRGQELVLLARTHHDLPDDVTIQGRLGGEDFERVYPLVRDTTVVSQLVPRLWAAAFVERLLGDSRGPEAVRGKILSLGLEYGLMTPYTSLLALDSEQAYANMGIGRRQRRFGPVQLTDAGVSHLPPVRETRGVGLLSGAAAMLSAPLGCGSRREDEAMKEVAAQQAPAPAASPPVTADDLSATTPTTPASPPNALAAPAHSNRPMAAQEAEAPAPPAMPAKLPSRPKSEADLPEGEFGRAAGGGEAPDGKLMPAVVVGKAATKEAKRAHGSRDRHKARRAVLASPVTRDRKEPCSDASSRALGHRKVLWQKRLQRAESMVDRLNAYEAAAGSCEIKGWRDQRVFLHMLQQRATTEAEVELLLVHFGPDLDGQKYLARVLLRRLVEPALVAAVNRVMFGAAVDWREVDRQLGLALNVDEQILVVRTALAKAPGDPGGEMRLLGLLARSGRLEDAIARGNRLLDQGLMTPLLAQQLGEVLVRNQRTQDAMRVFSEIVEFDPEGEPSRRLLGDIFFRHGWFDAAYRQYEELVRIVPEDAPARIRLARAAASAGRVDEGLRRLRKVAAGEGRPGADDPRRWARLHAAAYLGAILESGHAPKDQVTRELRRLQLFDAPMSWTLLVWADLSTALTLAPTDPKQDMGQADTIDAAITGLLAVPVDASGWTVRHRGLPPDRDTTYQLVRINWTGSAFKITRTTATVPSSPPV